MRLALAFALALGASQADACAVDGFTLSPFKASETVDFETAGMVRRAWFDGPTTIYDHRILGREDEPEVLVVQDTPDGNMCGNRIAAGDGHVFEDTAPRLHDLDGDSTNEVIVVRTDINRGAQLAVYGVTSGSFGLRAATDYIGTRHRWLAPAGVADFDGDGRIEIAYVDRPHLLRELVFVRLEGDLLVEVARAAGLTNHRIGDEGITSAVRRCGGQSEVLLPDAGWSRLMAVRLAEGQVVARDAGPLRSTFPGRVPSCRG